MGALRAMGLQRSSSQQNEHQTSDDHDEDRSLRVGWLTVIRKLLPQRHLNRRARRLKAGGTPAVSGEHLEVRQLLAGHGSDFGFTEDAGWGRSLVDAGWGRSLVVSSNAGPSGLSGINLNDLVGASAFYDAGFTGTRSIAGNIEAGHIWNQHESLTHVITQVATTVDAGLQTGEYDRHATWVGMILGGRPVLAANDWQRGIAWGADVFSGAIATTWSGDPYTTAFNYNTASFITPYRLMMLDGVGAASRTVDVINSSWNTSDTSGSANGIFSRGIDALANLSGVPVVFAAGNTGPASGTVGGPAAGYNVITVGAVGSDRDAMPYQALTNFSSRGLNEVFVPKVQNPTDVFNVSQGTLIPASRAVVDLVAPGMNITSALYGGISGGNVAGSDATSGAVNQYSFNIEGTSFASPMVAGGLALIADAAKATFGEGSLAIDGRVSKSILQTSATKLVGWDNHQTLIGDVITTTQSLDAGSGAGLLDLAGAWDVLMTGTADVSGDAGGRVADRGWDYGIVAQDAPNDYYIRNIIPEGGSITTTLNWFVDRELTSANVSSEVSFDNLNLEVWLTDGSQPVRKVAESISQYNNVEHLNFSAPESGLYMLRVRWAGENWDLINDTNAESYGLSWDADGLPAGDDPSVYSNAADIVFSNENPHVITAIFMDDASVDVNTINQGDLQITTPSGDVIQPQLMDLTVSDQGRVVTTHWRLDPSAKEWDSSDNGNFLISISGDAVLDVDGNGVAGGIIGQFEVSIAPAVGPDSFGYVAESTEFEFDDISLTGHAILVRSDDESVPISDAALGDFQFPFYGQTYSTLFVSSNGLISFGAGQVAFSNGNLNGSPAQAGIAVLWDDLEASTNSGKVFWQVKGSGENQRLVVQWNRYQYYLADGEITFQAVLDRDGRIQFNYLDLAGNDTQQDEGQSATLGIKAAGESQAPHLLVSQDDSTGLYVGSRKSVSISLARDYGDAPLPYPVSALEDGARHVAIGPMLGSRRDWDRYGVHSEDAFGDDSRRESDEDGVLFPSVMQSGTDVVVSIIATESSRLDAWFDWNQDGDWMDAGEQVSDSVRLNTGVNSLTVSVPPGYSADTFVIARFRVSSSGNLSPQGAAADGEVEDYRVAIQKQGRLQLRTSADSLSENGGSLIGSVSRSETDLSASLTVSLTNHDPSELMIPATVVIPAGETQATFLIQAIDDSLLDGDVLVRIVASTEGPIRLQPDEHMVQVTDYETLTLLIDRSTVMEHRGTGARTGTLIRNNTDLSLPLNVSLSSSDHSELRVPVTVTIPAGLNSVTFPVDAVDDTEVDGAVPVTLSAFHTSYMGGAVVQVTVRDNDGPWFQIQPSGGTTQVTENGSADHIAVVLTHQPQTDVVLNLSVSDATEVAIDRQRLTFSSENWNVPQEVTVSPVDDLLFDGSQLSQIVVEVIQAESDVLYGEIDPEPLDVVTLDNEPPVPVVLLPVTDTRTSTPQITWTQTPGATLYEVWVSNVTTNTPKVVHDFVTGNQLDVSTPLPLGRYRVWVRVTLLSGAVSPWSQARTFEINTAAQLIPLASRQTHPQPTLTWISAPGAATTEVWIENRVTGAAGRIRQTGLTGTQYQIPQVLPIGLYRAWVRQTDSGGRPVAWSGAIDWTITTPPGLLAPGSSTFDLTPEFRWAAVAGARRYEFVLEDLITKAIVLRQFVTGLTAFTPVSNLAQGLYRWRVRAEGDNGIAGDWSNHSQLFIGGRPNYTGPVGEVQNPKPVFTWQSVDDASSYTVFLQRIDVPGTVIQVTGIKGTQYVPASALANGRYRFWVRAVSGSGQLSPWSPGADIRVNI